MKGANSILRSAAGRGITLHMPQETFMNLRGQYFTNAGNKALVNLNSKPNPILTSTINHLYKEYPELSLIGPKEAYRQYYETIFPASKVQTPYAHGTKSDLSGGLETSVKIPNAAAPETIGRNDFYLNLYYFSFPSSSKMTIINNYFRIIDIPKIFFNGSFISKFEHRSIK